MDIRDELGLIPGRGSPADAPAPGDDDAGGLALKGAEDEFIFLGEVEAGPVDIRKGVVDQGGDVGEVCDEMNCKVKYMIRELDI